MLCHSGFNPQLACLINALGFKAEFRQIDVLEFNTSPDGLNHVSVSSSSSSGTGKQDWNASVSFCVCVGVWFNNIISVWLK